MKILRLNILISSHELNPYGGSECAEGWNVVTRLVMYHNITVLYAKGSQFSPSSYEFAMNDFFSKNTNPYNIKFISIEQTKATQFVSKLNRIISKNTGSIGNPLLYYIGYFFWEKQAFRIARQLCVESKFHIIHHLTSISFREPGFLWKLPIPFVWGPTGGLSKIPYQFYKYIGFKSSFHEITRNIINQLQFKANNRIQKVIKKSSLIYTFSKEDQFIFYNISGKQPKLLLDAAALKPTMKNINISRDSNLISVLWCGELIKRKSLDIILFAISSDPQLKQRITLKIVGSGHLELQYKDLCDTLNINNCVEWIGQVDRPTVFKIMDESDLFVHSSYREGTGHVITEALSHGLPVICHDINGMSIAVNDECGIKIPLINPEKSINGFKNALLELTNNSTRLKKLQMGAINRSQELSWDAMAETIATDYLSIYEKYKNIKIEQK